MSRCAIGISAAVERVRWGVWDQVVTMVPRTYATAVQATGAVALVLPPDPSAGEDADPFLDLVDALLLSGGADLDPGSYGAEAHPETAGTRPERDAFEIALARGAIARGMPLLGVCRGMEVLNVARGGTLVQHLPDMLDADPHRPTPGAFSHHDVRLEPGSLAARALGVERLTVSSHHHQGVDQLGDGLVAAGWSVSDDVVEAIELPGAGFCLGVLWHPEEDEGPSPVIEALVAAADPPASDRAAPGRGVEEVAR